MDNISEKNLLKIDIKPASAITIKDVSNLPNATHESILEILYNNKYDGYINRDNSYNFFTINNGVDIHLYQPKYTSKFTFDVSSIDISNGKFNMLLKFGASTDLSNILFVDISRSKSSTINEFYINDTKMIYNSTLVNEVSSNITPQPSDASGTATATGGGIGNITIEQGKDASLFNYLLSKIDPNLQTNYFNPYTSMAFEHAMNSNLNPLVNYPSIINPIQYSNAFLNPNATDAIMGNAQLNNSITPNATDAIMGNAQLNNSITPNATDAIMGNAHLNNPINNLNLPKSSKDIRDTVNLMNFSNKNNNKSQEINCTCPNKQNYKDEKECPPCPACDICSKNDFESLKVNTKKQTVTQPSYSNNTKTDPLPMLADFSAFGT
jgi:hypothetical protein